MTRLIQIVDGWILARVERASHQVQRLTGRDCFDQSRWCMVIAAAQQLVPILYTAGLPLWLAITTVVIATLGCGFYLLVSVGSARLDDWRRSRTESGVANDLKAFPLAQSTRFMSVIIGIILIVFAGVTVIAIVCLSLYLDACDPLPPCRGKVREWLDNMKLVIATASETPARD